MSGIKEGIGRRVWSVTPPGCVLMIIVLVIAAWMAWHQKKSRQAISTLNNHGAAIEAIMAQQGFDSLLVHKPDGSPVLVIRSPGESMESWFANADRVQAGEDLGPGVQCETLHCTSGDVRLCIACQLGESREDCRARLQDAIAVYCQTHSCDECQ